MRKLWLIGGAAVVIAAGAAFVVLSGAKSPMHSASDKDKKPDVTLEFTSREVVSPKNVALPRRIEFWQGKDHRLHDRFCFTREKEGAWAVVRLAP